MFIIRPGTATRYLARALPRRECRRTFFTPPELPSFLSSASDEPQTYHERKIFPYPPSQLYKVVSDVESYPHFIPYCAGARILSRTPSQGPHSVTKMEAEMTVRFMAFEASYTSHVTCTPNLSVEAVASSSSPIFKSLSTIWRFQPAASRSPHPSNATALSTPVQSAAPSPSGHASSSNGPAQDQGPTLVTLDLSFLFANAAYAGASQMFFGQVSKMMVSAFEQRCLELYGPGDR